MANKCMRCVHKLKHISCIAGLRAWCDICVCKVALQLTHPILGAVAGSSGRLAMRVEEAGTSISWASAGRLRGSSPPWCEALHAQPAQHNAMVWRMHGQT